MIYICAICTAKRKSLTLLTTEHRRLLEAVLTPVIDMVDMRSRKLLNCTDCKLMLESIHKFQQIALNGVKTLQLLYHTIDKQQAIIEHAYAKPMVATVKMEPEVVSEVTPTVSQEFVALKDADPLKEELDIKFEPDSEPDHEHYYGSDSTVSCDSPKPETLNINTVNIVIEPEVVPIKSEASNNVPAQSSLYNIRGKATLQSKKLKEIEQGIATDSGKILPHAKTEQGKGYKVSSILRSRGVVEGSLESKVLRQKAEATASAPKLTYDRVVPKMATTPMKSEGNFEVYTHHTQQKQASGPFLSSIRWMEGIEHTNYAVKRKKKKRPPGPCPHCGKTITGSALSEHIARMHVEASPVTCDECGKQLRNQNVLKVHKYQHMRRKQLQKIDDIEQLRSEYFCKQCKIQFPGNAAYRAHLATLKHMSRDQYEFECDTCKKKMATKKTLEEHIDSMHLRLRNHKCDKCDKAFYKATSLRVHKRYVHDKEAKERKHVCHLCGKGFTVKRILEEHINQHQGLRPHQCPLCPANFTYKAALFTHNRLKHLKIKGKWKKKTAKKGKKKSGGEKKETTKVGLSEEK